MHHLLWSAVEHLQSGDDSSSLEGNKFKASLQDCMLLEESSSSVTGDRASSASAALNQNISGAANAHAESVQSSPVVPATSVIKDLASDASAALNQNIRGVADAHEEPVQSSPVVPAMTVELLKAANMWSQGTALHGTKNCQPCRYIHLSQGCKDGLACNFCHAPHTSFAQKRPGKNRRQQCKHLVDIAQDLQMNVAPELLGNQSSYMQNLLKSGKNSEETQPREKNLIML